MQTFYNNIGGVLHFKSLDLQSDNSVVELEGEVGQMCYPQITQHANLSNAKDYFSTSLSQTKEAYSHKPVVLTTSIRVLPPNESTDEVESLLKIYETIADVLRYSGNGEIGDGAMEHKYYKVNVEVIDIVQLTTCLSTPLQELGVKDWKVDVV